MQRLGGVLFIVIAVSCIAVSAVLVGRETAFLSRAKVVGGTVKSFTRGVDASRSPFMRVTVSVSDTSGVHDFEYVESTNQEPPIGSGVDVQYDPADPSSARRSVDNRLPESIPGVIGGTFLFLAIRALWQSRQKAQKPAA